MGKHEALIKKFRTILTTADTPRERFRYSVGPLSLNLAIGHPEGMKSGRFIQVFGREQVGKSTLALDTIRQYQEKNPEEVAMIVDYERAFEEDYARGLMVDLKRLFVLRPDTTEDGMDVIEAALEDGIKLIVVDSIAAGKSSSEDNKTFGDSAKIASSAGLWSRFMARNLGRVDNSNALVILLNQMRANMNPKSPEDYTPFGAMSVKHGASLFIELKKISTEETRSTIQAVIKKNRVGAPQKRTQYYIDYGVGINHDLDVLTLALNRGIINKAGAWYSYVNPDTGEIIKAQGENRAAIEFPIAELRQKVLQGEK